MFTRFCTLLLLSLPSALWAQSSSLYVTDAPAPEAPLVNGVRNRLSPQLADVSLTAVQVPEPRQFGVHDLVTIIIRESTESQSESELETNKETDLKGEVSDWPNIRLLNYFYNAVAANDLDQQPKVGISFNKDFKGEGDYSRRDSFTSRVTARIIDIKPNGTIVLEARKYIQSDKESLDMVLTGTCRQEDISIDNTVLSTQMYDLRLTKQHKGELRDASKKGVLTKFFEALFAF